MKLFKPSNLLSSLTIAEKKKIRESVIPEFEKYRFFREIEHLTKDQETFCKRIENAVDRLPSIEKSLITKRYMGHDSEYVTDYQVYSMLMETPLSEPTYSRIKNNAMVKIALFLGIYTGVEISID